MNLYQHHIRRLDGGEIDLSTCQGKVLLLVNTASACGFTPQYAELEQLHRQFADSGLVIIGFPCNQFGQQEAGDTAQIGAFCQQNYGVSFTMSDKINVNGTHADPLWQFLKQQKAGLLGSRRIKWNFTKFLVDRQGQVRGRYGPLTRPLALTGKIRSLL